MAKAVILRDSALGDVVQHELETHKYQVISPEIWRHNREPVEAIICCTEASLREPRKILDDATFNDQWHRLVENEVKVAFQLVVEALPFLVRNFQATGKPSTIIFLASKVMRASNSPQQIVASLVKRAVGGFAASLFFERRMDGIRVSYINPTPEITTLALAQSLVFPLLVDNRVCIENIDLIAVKAFPKSKWSYGACFVSGGSRGIGKGIALRIAREFKMPMALLGRDVDQLQAVAQECGKYCGSDRVRIFAFDARETTKLKDAIDYVGKEFGGISCLVWSAGINRRASAVSPDNDKVADPKIFHELMDINFTSSMYATQYALPYMIRRPEGPAIFYVGSRTIRVGNAPGQQAYIASKMAINGYAASVQQEIKSLGVRVVTLNVGLVATDLGNKSPKKGNFQVAPPETQMQPDNIADAVVFTLKMDPSISLMNFDICGVQEEFLNKDGKALKLSNL